MNIHIQQRACLFEPKLNLQGVSLVGPLPHLENVQGSPHVSLGECSQTVHTVRGHFDAGQRSSTKLSASS